MYFNYLTITKTAVVMQIQRVPAAENYKKYLLSLGSKVIRIRSLSLKAVLLAKVHLCFLKRCMLVW